MLPYEIRLSEFADRRPLHERVAIMEWATHLAPRSRDNGLRLAIGFIEGFIRDYAVSADEVEVQCLNEAIHGECSEWALLSLNQYGERVREPNIRYRSDASERMALVVSLKPEAVDRCGREKLSDLREQRRAALVVRWREGGWAEDELDPELPDDVLDELGQMETMERLIAACLDASQPGRAGGPRPAAV